MAESTSASSSWNTRAAVRGEAGRLVAVRGREGLLLAAAASNKATVSRDFGNGTPGLGPADHVLAYAPPAVGAVVVVAAGGGAMVVVVVVVGSVGLVLVVLAGLVVVLVVLVAGLVLVLVVKVRDATFSRTILSSLGRIFCAWVKGGRVGDGWRAGSFFLRSR